MPELVWKDVLSSRVSKVAYDPEAKQFFVAFNRGTYVYDGVPAEVADEVSKSWSVGAALNERIIGKYPARKV